MPQKKTPGAPLRLLKQWMKLATTHEQVALARGALTSREYLYQIGNGARVASPEIAGRIETAARRLTASSKGRLPTITRADLSTVCGGCPYAKKCMGEKNARKLRAGKNSRNSGKASRRA